MWLLDVNLPNGLLRLLTRFGTACEAAIGRGWRGLTNGELASIAFDAGFHVILTRDREFAAAADKVLARLPELAIVIVTIPQAREAAYLEAFEANWRARAIIPIPGNCCRVALGGAQTSLSER